MSYTVKRITPKEQKQDSVKRLVKQVKSEKSEKDAKQDSTHEQKQHTALEPEVKETKKTNTASYVVASKAHASSENNFESKTQYDRSFDDIYKEYPKAKRGLACPLFALVTASEYFRTKNISKEKHEENLQKAVNISAMINTNQQMMFNKLISFTNLEPRNIVCTSTDIIKQGVTTFNVIIPGTEQNSCVIFLKNAKFFVVICDQANQMFCVRDCREPFQYNFENKQKLIDYLNDVYSLSSDFIVDGVTFPEYSSIEYIVIQKQFTDNIDQQLERALFGNTDQGSTQHQQSQTRVQHVQNNLIIKPVATNYGSAVVGYVENLPDDGVDMTELQHRFDDEYIAFEKIKQNDMRRQFDDANFDSDGDYESEGDESSEDFRYMQPHNASQRNRQRPYHRYDEEEFFSDDDNV